MTKEEIIEVIKQNIADNLDDVEITDIDPQKTMKDYGANSLDIVEVVSCTMRDLKVKVPRSELSKLTNVTGLVELLYQVANEKEQQKAAS